MTSLVEPASKFMVADGRYKYQCVFVYGVCSVQLLQSINQFEQLLQLSTHKMNSFSNNSSGSSANNQNKDYVDKGLEAVEKKYGGEWGQNTEKNRAMNEKIVRPSSRRTMDDANHA